MSELTGSQRDVLRDISRTGRALKSRRGWRVAGAVRRVETMRALVTRGFVREDFQRGKHVAVLTPAGRLEADKQAPPTLLPRARAYWLD